MADKPTKRVVKNPETFRERALKANKQNDKSGRFNGFKRVLGSITRPIAKPISAAYKKIVNFKLFRPLRKPLRIIGKVILPVYIRNSWHELRQVTWPSWRESLRLTYAVLVFAIIFGSSIALVDYGLDKVFRNILLK